MTVGGLPRKRVVVSVSGQRCGEEEVEWRAQKFKVEQQFGRSLPRETAMSAEPILAYAMNDQPLPMLNGFPLRLVVPGWFGTYWVKALNEINVLAEPFEVLEHERGEVEPPVLPGDAGIARVFEIAHIGKIRAIVGAAGVLARHGRKPDHRS